MRSAQLWILFPDKFKWRNFTQWAKPVTVAICAIITINIDPPPKKKEVKKESQNVPFDACETIPSMVFSVTYTLCEGPKLDARSQSVTSVNFQYDTIHQHKENYRVKIYIHSDIAHWNTCEDSLAISMQGEEISLSSLMASVMCLHFSVQQEDIHEDMNVKCHYCTR